MAIRKHSPIESLRRLAAALIFATVGCGVSKTTMQSAGSSNSPTPLPPSPPPSSSLAAPTLTLADSSALDPHYTNQQALAATITNDSSAVKWCLSEAQSSAPATNVAPCTGGTGAAGNGYWATIRPTAYTLANMTNGLKTVYIWIADGNGTINSAPATATITLDTQPPTAGTPVISGP